VLGLHGFFNHWYEMFLKNQIQNKNWDREMKTISLCRTLIRRNLYWKMQKIAKCDVTLHASNDVPYMHKSKKALRKYFLLRGKKTAVKVISSFIYIFNLNADSPTLCHFISLLFLINPSKMPFLYVAIRLFNILIHQK